MLAMISGCTAGGAQETASASSTANVQHATLPSGAAAEQTAADQSGYTGLWAGTSVTNCMPLQPEARRCNAVVKITLQIFQQGSTLTGHYTCAMGTMVCRDSNNTGTIANGTVRGRSVGMRVMMPDGSSCLFNGRPASDNSNRLTGSYFCMQGGGYIEQGRFQVDRSY